MDISANEMTAYRSSAYWIDAWLEFYPDSPGFSVNAELADKDGAVGTISFEFKIPQPEEAAKTCTR